MAGAPIVEEFDWTDRTTGQVLNGHWNRVAEFTSKAIRAFLVEHFADGTHRSPLVVVGSGHVTDNGGEPVTYTLQNAVGNVASVANNGTGTARITLEPDMVDANYVVLTTAVTASSSYMSVVESVAAGTFDVEVYNNAGNGTTSDFVFVVLGRRKEGGVTVAVSDLDWVNRPWDWLFGYEDANTVANKVKNLISTFLTEHGTDGTHSTNTPGAADYLGTLSWSGSAYSIASQEGSFTINRLSAGNVEVTLGSAYSNQLYKPIPQVVATDAYFAKSRITATNTFVIEIYDDAGTASDSTVSFAVWE